MRGTKERFDKLAHLLPQSQGIMQPAVEPPHPVNHDDCNCSVCGRRVGDHTPVQVFACGHKLRAQLLAEKESSK